MNRRRFFKILGIVAGALGLPTRVISWDPVKLEEVFPPPCPEVVGFKRSQFLETGYVYAPYIPLCLTGEQYKLKQESGIYAVLKQTVKKYDTPKFNRETGTRI